MAAQESHTEKPPSESPLLPLRALITNSGTPISYIQTCILNLLRKHWDSFRKHLPKCCHHRLETQETNKIHDPSRKRNKSKMKRIQTATTLGTGVSTAAAFVWQPLHFLATTKKCTVDQFGCRPLAYLSALARFHLSFSTTEKSVKRGWFGC